MKKFLTILVLSSFLFSCSKETINEEIKIISPKKETFTVWLKENNFINIYGNIVNSSVKIISPNISWKISSLNCEVGTKVSPNTLIASISPNYDWQAYQSSSIQANALIEQIQKLNEMKKIASDTIEAQKSQILLQKDELENSRENIFQNIWNDNSWIQNQIKILEETIELLKKNKTETENEINTNAINLRKNIYNTIIKSTRKLDEIFAISDYNKNINISFNTYLWAKNSIWKNKIIYDWKEILNFAENLDENLSNFSNEDISKKLDEFSVFFKDASQIIKDSLAAETFSQTTIESLYAEFLGYSDAFITLKNNLEKIENSKEQTKTSFDLKLKEIESQISNLKNEEKNLQNKQNSINISEKNIDEQISILEENKKSTLKEIDLQILAAEQNLKSVWVNLKSENLYAEVYWTIKQKLIKAEWSQVQVWSQICEIIPEKNSLKLEIYSPEKLELWEKFNFYQNWKQIWNWTIIIEYPERNPQTQNFIYEWKINFWDLKLWEYLDIKILKESENNEIWIPLKFVSPKLDWNFVKKVVNGENINQKVEVWNMNNWEINIISGLEKGDILEN